MMTAMALTLTPGGKIPSPEQQMEFGNRAAGAGQDWIEKRRDRQRLLLDIPSQGQYWKTLLHDNRTIPRKKAKTASTPVMIRFGTLSGLPPEVRTVAVEAASLFLELRCPEDAAAIQNILTVTPETAARIIRERANALLAGKKPEDLPPIPNADQVSRPQREKLGRKLTAASRTGAEALAAEFAKLTPAERLALQEELAQNAKLAGTLAGLTNRITEVVIKNGIAQPLRSVLESLRGKVLEKQSVLEICKACRR